MKMIATSGCKFTENGLNMTAYESLPQYNADKWDERAVCPFCYHG